MSVNKLDLSAICEHSYCPHQHYKKCRKQRQRNIPYTYRPNNKIDTTCNIHPKVLGGLTTRNVTTLAFEKYIAHPVLADEEDNNFGRNYYLENCPQTYQLNNTLLAETQEELARGNAYTLAQGATDDYNQFAKKRQEYLDNARRRANVAFNQYYANKKMASQTKREEQARWVTEYFRKVQELIDHIFKKKKANLDDSTVKEKMFIREQSANTSQHLATVKVKDPTIALNILESLRAVLLRKKMDLQQNRKDQEHNKSVTVSCLDSSNTSQNVSSASFMSSVTNSAAEVEKQGTFAEKFCNFEALQKKWGKQNVQQVRNILRTMLCRNLITKAEGQEMRERKKAKEKNDFLRKQMEKMGKRKGGNKTTGKDGVSDKRQKTSKSVIEFSKENEKPVLFYKERLSKQQQVVKETLIRGGIFDSMGTRYQRNRNYGSLFSKRKEKSLLEISFKEDARQTGLTTNRQIR